MALLSLSIEKLSCSGSSYLVPSNLNKLIVINRLATIYLHIYYFMSARRKHDEEK